MANGKVHLLVGTGLAVAADFLWQHSQMANDPDRKFDWGELAIVGLCGGVVGLLADILEPAVHPHHRGFFHSIVFAALMVWALVRFGGKLTGLAAVFCAIMTLSYFSHLFLDALTPRSLPFIGKWRC